MDSLSHIPGSAIILPNLQERSLYIQILQQSLQSVCLNCCLPRSKTGYFTCLFLMLLIFSLNMPVIRIHEKDFIIGFSPHLPEFSGRL